MALWNGTTLDNHKVSMIFNHLYSKQAMDLVRKKNGLLYAVLGKREPGSTPGGGPRFEGLMTPKGNKIEVRLLGKLKNFSPHIPGDLSVARRTGTWENNVFANVEFARTTYAEKYDIIGDEYRNIMGKEAKTQSFLKDVGDMLMSSIEDTWGNAINSDNNQSIGSLGGWLYAVDADNVYGLDRSDAANIGFRGLERNVSSIDLATLNKYYNSLLVEGAEGLVGVADTVIYSKVQELVQAKMTLVINTSDWDEFGGSWVRHGGVSYILDQRVPVDSSGNRYLGLLSPNTWTFYRTDNMTFNMQGIISDPGTEDSYILPWVAEVAFICRNPRRNMKVTGLAYT